MLSSDFNLEMGALLRRLESQVRKQPGLTSTSSASYIKVDVLDDLEKAIVQLVALHIALRNLPDFPG